MEEPPEPQSPRKRQKLASPTETSKLSEETAGEHIGQTPVNDASTLLSAADIQLKKETEVGITEFVSPDLPGFTGILKKRFIKTISYSPLHATTYTTTDIPIF